MGDQKHFQANPAAPLFSELRSIVLKTVGLIGPLKAALAPAEREIGRKISPTVYSREQIERRRTAGNAFITKVLAGERIVVMGDEHGLGAP